MRYVFAPLMVLSSLLVGLNGWFVGTMSCDDGCGANPEHWSNDPNAAEWGNMVLFSGCIAVTALVLLGAVIAGKQGLALGLLIFQGVLTFALARLLESSSSSYFEGHWILLFVPVLLGAATLAGLRWDVRRASGP